MHDFRFNVYKFVRTNQKQWLLWTTLRPGSQNGITNPKRHPFLTQKLNNSRRFKTRKCSP